MNEVIARAIQACGSQTALAQRARCSQQAVSNYLRGSRRVPAELVKPLCEAAKWAVLPHEVRPDIYEPPHEAA